MLGGRREKGRSILKIMERLLQLPSLLSLILLEPLPELLTPVLLILPLHLLLDPLPLLFPLTPLALMEPLKLLDLPQLQEALLLLPEPLESQLPRPRRHFQM